MTGLNPNFDRKADQSPFSTLFARSWRKHVPITQLNQFYIEKYQLNQSINKERKYQLVLKPSAVLVRRERFQPARLTEKDAHMLLDRD